MCSSVEPYDRWSSYSGQRHLRKNKNVWYLGKYAPLIRYVQCAPVAGVTRQLPSQVLYFGLI